MFPPNIMFPPNMRRASGTQALQGGILTNSRLARGVRFVALLVPLALVVLVATNLVGRYSYLPAMTFTAANFTTNFNDNFSTNAEELQGMPPQWQMAVKAVTDLATNFNTNFTTNHEAKPEAEALIQEAEVEEELVVEEDLFIFNDIIEGPRAEEAATKQKKEEEAAAALKKQEEEAAVALKRKTEEEAAELKKKVEEKQEIGGKARRNVSSASREQCGNGKKKLEERQEELKKLEERHEARPAMKKEGEAEEKKEEEAEEKEALSMKREEWQTAVTAVTAVMQRCVEIVSRTVVLIPSEHTQMNLDIYGSLLGEGEGKGDGVGVGVVQVGREGEEEGAKVVHEKGTLERR
jgi:hypothetical protein